MANYYDEITNTIQELMAKNEYEKAIKLLESELAMQYVPKDSLELFEKLYRECQIELRQGEDVDDSLMSFAAIEKSLLEDQVSAMMAIESLSKLHVASYTKELQRLLLADLDPLVSAMVILILVEQRVDAHFEVKQNGLLFEFNPYYVEHPVDSDGYLKAVNKLDELLSQDPSTFELCHQLLAQETLLMLPLSYEEAEGDMLAVSIIRAVDLLSGRQEVWRQRVVKYDIDEKYLLPLRSTLVSTH